MRFFKCTCGVEVKERKDPEAEPIIFNLNGHFHSCLNVFHGKRFGKDVPEYPKLPIEVI